MVKERLPVTSRENLPSWYSNTKKFCHEMEKRQSEGKHGEPNREPRALVLRGISVIYHLNELLYLHVYHRKSRYFSCKFLLNKPELSRKKIPERNFLAPMHACFYRFQLSGDLFFGAIQGDHLGVYLKQARDSNKY